MTSASMQPGQRWPTPLQSGEVGVAGDVTHDAAPHRRMRKWRRRNPVAARPSGTQRMACTVGEYILRRLRALGVDHIFGVPGDFAMNFFEQVRSRLRERKRRGSLNLTGRCLGVSRLCTAT